ncbi:hypothetical protein C8Q78DRAFT_990736 [Trametes maxima]|nr:hypothetical protein C8Q78DRAFT_990736 [Trametes maxima]
MEFHAERALRLGVPVYGIRGVALSLCPARPARRRHAIADACSLRLQGPRLEAVTINRGGAAVGLTRREAGGPAYACRRSPTAVLAFESNLQVASSVPGFGFTFTFTFGGLESSTARAPWRIYADARGHRPRSRDMAISRSARTYASSASVTSRASRGVGAPSKCTFRRTGEDVRHTCLEGWAEAVLITDATTGHTMDAATRGRSGRSPVVDVWKDTAATVAEAEAECRFGRRPYGARGPWLVVWLDVDGGVRARCQPRVRAPGISVRTVLEGWRAQTLEDRKPRAASGQERVDGSVRMRAAKTGAVRPACEYSLVGPTLREPGVRAQVRIESARTRTVTLASVVCTCMRSRSRQSESGCPSLVHAHAYCSASAGMFLVPYDAGLSMASGPGSRGSRRGPWQWIAEFRFGDDFHEARGLLSKQQQRQRVRAGTSEDPWSPTERERVAVIDIWIVGTGKYLLVY